MTIYIFLLIIAAMWIIIGDLMFDLIQEEAENPNREKHEVEEEDGFEEMFLPWARFATMVAGPLMYVYSVFFDRDKE